MYRFRQAAPADLDAMERIAAEGKAYLKSRGVSQWQRGSYPDRAVFEGDLQHGIGYVVEDDGEVIAVCALTFTDEEDYRHLLDGEWLTPAGTRYATVHRSAVAAASRGKHVSSFLFEQAGSFARQQGAASLRVDTHPDNLVMQGALARAGFMKTGSLVLLHGDEQGDLRWGYEKLL